MTMPIGRLRSLPDLNFDILLQIMSLLTRQDVACLTRTCRALRIALSAELPREDVTLEGRHLASFLMFASVKDGRGRLSYFNKLILPGSTYDESLSSGEQAMSMKDVKRALSDILNLVAHSLESLSILDLDAFSFRPLELKKMFGSLPHLRELEMSGIDKKYQDALAVDALTQLRTLTLAFLEDETDASPFLKAPHSDLQAVTLYNGTFGDASASLPTVHTLRACPAKLPGDVDAYTHIFPNVRHVILDFPRDHVRMDVEFQKRMRSCHPYIEWPSPYVQSWPGRADFLRRRQKKADAWPHLQSLRAVGHGAVKLSWAGLTCQVARVEVSCSQLLNQQLANVLNELHPRCVCFHPSSFHGPWMDRSFEWGQLLALQDAPFVTGLAIVLCRETMGYVCQAVWLVRRAAQRWPISAGLLTVLACR